VSSIAEIARRIERDALAHINKNLRHILCVSGGLDSMVLLHAYRLLYDQSAINEPVVFHLDHQIRPESFSDASFVCSKARDFGFAFYIETRSAKTFARRAGLGLEESGRVLRYRALARLIDDLGTAIAVTAHHADDYVESFMIHLLRGGGPSALSTLALFSQTENVNVFRPMVLFTRSELEEAATGIEFRSDSTNTDRAYLRNRIRLDITPALKREGLDAKKLWRNFHDDNAVAIPPLADRLKLDRRLVFGATVSEIKRLLDITFSRMHLAPASRALCERIAATARLERFRFRFDSNHVRMWCDERGPVHVFRADCALFSSMYVAHEPDLVVSYAGIKKPIRLLPGDRIANFSDGVRYRLKPTGTRKLKKLFQEIGLPVQIRPHLPIVLDPSGMAVRVCSSFFEGEDLFFWRGPGKN